MTYWQHSSPFFSVVFTGDSSLPETVKKYEGT